MHTKKWGRNYKEGDVEGYEPLASVLQSAYFRAAKGKGLERHAKQGEDFLSQDICNELRIFESVSPALFQARKKIKESRLLDKDAAVKELLDAIVYCAAAVTVLEEGE